MDAAERPQEIQNLYSRRGAIADSWYRAITPTDFSPFGAAEVRQQLTELTERAITCLAAEPFENVEAQAIGAALVKLGFSHPDTLANTLAILATQFTDDLSDAQIAALQPRLMGLLTELTRGFSQQAVQRLLAQQEQINRAFLDERQRLSREMADIRRNLAAYRHTEQVRLADVLFDEVLQQALGIYYQASAPVWRLTNDSKPLSADELIASLKIIKAQLQDMTRQLRALIYEMHLPGLLEFGLVAGLRGLVERVEAEAGSKAPGITLDLEEGITGVSDTLTYSLFHIAQEALRNSIKHAQAQQVTLSLRVQAGELVFRVSDDGRGFWSPSQLSQLTQAGHFGLASISEHVEMIGGQLNLLSKPGGGTELAVRVPFKVGD